jgi:hypothetical protein
LTPQRSAGKQRCMDDKLIDRMGRHFVAVCKRGGPRVSGHAAVFHAVTPECRIALCGAEPGPRSGWAEPAEQVTCPQCLTRLARLQGPAREAIGAPLRG